MKKRIVSVILALILVLPLCPVFSDAAAHFAGSGTEADPYIIADAAGWAQFAADVNAGEDAGGYYRLAEGFDNSASPVTVTAGTAEHPFSGVFDGGGRTLTVNINDQSSEGTAPFRYISGASIRNLTVTGSVAGHKYVSGLVGFADAQNAVENCTVNVAVSLPITGAKHCFGGIVGNALSSTLYLTGAVFTGTLDYPHFIPGDSVGGLVGGCEDGARLSFDRCLYAGRFNGPDVKYFHPVAVKSANAGVEVTAENLYYTQSGGLWDSACVVTNAGKRLYVPNVDRAIMRPTEIMGYTLADENGLVQISGPSGYPYSGEVIDTDHYTLTQNDGRVLTEGVDYIVTFSKEPIRDKGLYNLTFTGIGEYVGSAQKTVFVGGTDCNIVSRDSTEWNNGYYIADGNVTIPYRITITGEVHLYLCAGAVLNASVGIRVPEGATLIIDAEDDTGKLNAEGNRYYAGIGGNRAENGGTIIINGGTINSKGKERYVGIGGSYGSCRVIINGGVVTATGGDSGAGIGGESNADGYSSVTINGGTVTANGGQDNAGIGGGADVIINGGTVVANGGACGAGIGGSASQYSFGNITINGGTVTATGGSGKEAGAGIGGGRHNQEGTVTINGGTVTATGGSGNAYAGAGIGGGGSGSGATVTINGGTVTAYGGSGRKKAGAGIGNGSNSSGTVVVLGWTNESDSIFASSYNGLISFAENKLFIRSDNGELASGGNIGGVRIVPFTGTTYRVSLAPMQHGSAGVSFTETPAGQTVTVNWTISEYPYVLEGVAVRSASGKSIDFEYTGANRGTFCMPNENVTVTVTAVSVPNVTLDVSEGSADCAPILPCKTTYTSGWYAVTGTVEISERMVVSGNVNIYLRQGSKLILDRGVTVSPGNSLLIEGEGEILANASGVSYSAGIGGAGEYGHCGTVIIRGGVIEARGGSMSAGIGGGFRGNGGDITISGGSLSAIGGYLAPGIGGGLRADGGDITILGGQVTAQGSYYTAGIGHAYEGWGGSVLLGWTKSSDYIESSGYSGNVSFVQGRIFLRADTMEQITASALGSFRLIPAAGERYAVSSEIGGEGEGSVASNVSFAIEGQTVRFTLSYGYPSLLGSFTVTDAHGNHIETSTTDNRVFTLVMPAGDITATAVFDSAETVSRNTSEGAQNCLVLSTETLAYTSGWYTVKADTTFTGRVTFTGNVKLYIPEGITLTCGKGITVDTHDRFTVEGGGTLIADARDVGRAAGIGGYGEHGRGGTIILHDCVVEARGGAYAAGIGGGYYGGITGVTITGGTVSAFGGAYAAGIGGGEYGLGGNITITGGKVTAHGNNTAGMGYGYQSGRLQEVISLGWTSADDYIESNGYNGVVQFLENNEFLRADTMEEASTNALGNFRLLPKAGELYTVTVVNRGTDAETIKASVVSAVAGQTVYIDLTYSYPAFFSNLTIDCTGNTPVSVTSTDNKRFSVVMPAGNVTATAFFTYAPSLQINTSGGMEEFKLLTVDNDTYQSGQYTSDTDLTFTSRVTVTGDVRLYLYENVTLTFGKGITVLRGSSLTIEGPGALVADARGMHSCAGIGGTANAPYGSITIKGGSVTAYGGEMGAGIGGGGMSISDQPAEGGVITIIGGTVAAYGGSRATGIGGGAYGKGGTIVIRGGKVTAVKGSGDGTTGVGCVSGYSAGITFGWTNEDDCIDASGCRGDVTFALGKYFTLDNTNTAATPDNVDGHRLVPLTDGLYGINMTPIASYQSSEYSVRGIDQAPETKLDLIGAAPAGAKILVSVNPKYPYDFDGVTVITKSGVSVNASLESLGDFTTVYSFIMPDDEVTVSAVMTRLQPVTRMTPEGEFTFMPLRAYSNNWGTAEQGLSGVNFVVDRSVETWTIYIRDGAAKLYLDAGTTLNCQGIYFLNECEGLTIYGEGTLIADARNSLFDDSGIGPGNVTIYGGTIIAAGAMGCAGIGGGIMGNDETQLPYTIAIHGGNVTAVGGKFGGAGIGGGMHEYLQQILITGGTVNALGGPSGAGIGGGGYARGGNITITGGIVNATGGFEGAGIGGGYYGAGGNITITGGIVNATGGGSRRPADESVGYGAGIGDGSRATYGETNIVITGGQITARGDWMTDWSQAGMRVHSCDIGPGWNGACNNHVTLGWTDPHDFIDATAQGIGGEITLVADREFLLDGGNTIVTTENVNSGARLVPNCYPALTAPVTVPARNNELLYNGSPQALILPGSATGGTLKYCISDTQPSDAAYSTDVPTATEPGVYTVWYKAFGDENHLDTLPYSVTVTISKATVEHLTVELSQTIYAYDRTAKRPAVTVKNGNTVIDPSEYSVIYADNVGAGRATVIVSATPGGHYIFFGSAEFTITQRSVTIVGLSVENKLYDESTAATVTGTPFLNGVLEGDDVTLSDGYAAFDTPNMGTGKTVSFSGYALTGAHACNYVLASQPASVTASITALPISTGTTVLTMTELARITRSFTPETSDLYRFAANSDLFPAFFIYDGDTLICENWQGYYIGYFDDSVELEAGKDYMIQLYTGYEEGDVTLTIERAPLCTVAVDEGTAHGMIVDCTEEARMGDRVYVFTEADEGYALNYLVVTTLDGESVEVEPDGFIMPGKPVTVSAVFGAIHTIDFVCPAGVELWEFSPRLYANGEFSRPGEEETTAAYGAEIEIELWTDDRQSLAISVAAPSGEQLPVTYYREFGVWIARFTMPDEDLSVTLTLRDIADLNRDGGVSITDVTALLNFLAGMHPYIAFFDLDGNGSVSITDVTELLNILAGN